MSTAILDAAIEWRFGDPALPHRFWVKVHADAQTGCWIWTASRQAAGYGRFFTKGVGSTLAHRVAYTALVADIPASTRGTGSLTLDHLCRNRACVNPAHLELVTNRENILRGESPAAKHAAQTHCQRGHELSSDNLAPRDTTQRCCIACQHGRNRAISAAHHAVGMTKRAYLAEFGGSLATAERVIAEAAR